MVVVSGQVRRDTCLSHYGLIGKLRQLGDQEADILSMVRGHYQIRGGRGRPTHGGLSPLDRAIHLTALGRPGPVWIDIPVDVQGSYIDSATLLQYDPAEERHPLRDARFCRPLARRFSRASRTAQRPVIYAGSGLRMSGMYDQFLALIERLGVPVVTAWNSNDLLPNEHPLFVGRPGTLGDRAGNFAVQNADVLLVLGCRLNIRQVSYNWPCFARGALQDGCRCRRPRSCANRLASSICRCMPICAACCRFSCR